MKTLHAWLRVRDLERELGHAGFALARIRGSHRSYTHETSGARITFSPCGPSHSQHGLVSPSIVARVRRELRSACQRGEASHAAEM